jgi:xylulokinase
VFLGLDSGTSGVKGLLLADDHRVVCTADAPLTVQQPQTGWSEQHPHDWWAAANQVVALLRAQAPAAWAKVVAMGLSGQMHGAVVLGKDGQCLRPAMLWNDGRAAHECQVLTQQVPALHTLTGNIAMSGFTAPKLLWLRTHEPAVYAQIHRVLLPKDWVRLQLTGEAVSDMSDASGTLWLDVQHRRWSAPMLEACGLGERHMPRLVEGSAVSAPLLPTVAQAWGLGPRVMVAGGAGDNAASAIGVGAVDAGQGFVSLGTSGVIFLTDTHYRSAPEHAVHAFAHALPQRWHQMSVMLSAASALRWLAQLTGAFNEAALSAHVAQLSWARRERAPIFLPYLNGERTPHNDAHATGSWTGLRTEHGMADLAYAVMEGVAFGLMDGWHAMGQTSAGSSALALVGGGSRSEAWAQCIASGLMRPLERPVGAEVAAALGAARLAWLSAGADLSDVCRPLPAHRVFEPEARMADLLAPRYQRFKAVYQSLRPLDARQTSATF